MIAQKWLIAASSQVFLYFIATAEDDSQFAIFMYLNAFDHLTDDGIIISAFVLFPLVNGFLYLGKTLRQSLISDLTHPNGLDAAFELFNLF